MQQILIVGLGQFGMSLARSLSEKGAQVLAVDRRRDLVEEVSSYVANALALDATDEEALAGLHPEQRDACICAIGDDSKEGSIICTALLRQMGAKLVVARAGTGLHKRILLLVGAHQVVNPEEEFGQRFATQLAYKHVITDMPLSHDLHLTELEIPESFVGKTLKDLALPAKYSIMVVAVQRGKTGKVKQPAPDESLQADDRLFVVSNQLDIPRLLNEA